MPLVTAWSLPMMGQHLQEPQGTCASWASAGVTHAAVPLAEPVPGPRSASVFEEPTEGPSSQWEDSEVPPFIYPCAVSEDASPNVKAEARKTEDAKEGTPGCPHIGHSLLIHPQGCHLATPPRARATFPSLFCIKAQPVQSRWAGSSQCCSERRESGLSLPFDP